MQEEIWKDIEGFDNYQVSNFGNVKSKGKYVPYIDGRSGKKCQRWAKPTVLKWTVGTSGYPTTHIYNEVPERHTVMIHRLVAKHFLDPVEGKDFVNHIDGDKTNNHISNLEWVTKSENTIHAMENKLLLNCGEDNKCSKLTLDEVKLIVELYNNQGKPKCWSHEKLGKMFNVSGSTIGDTINGRKWKRALNE